MAVQHVCLACWVSLLQPHCPCFWLISDVWSLFDFQVEGHRARPHRLFIFVFHSWWFFSQSSTLSVSLCPSACRTASFIASLSLSLSPPFPLSSLRPQCLPVEPPSQFPSCLRGYQSHQEVHQQPYTSHSSSAPITALLTNTQPISPAEYRGSFCGD